MINITDNRSTDINLCNVEVGGCFIWKGELYQRIICPSNMVKAFIEAFAPDEIACINIKAGLLVGIDRLAYVEPVDVEIQIGG